MRFWKMNGAGNDFIVLNNLEERLSPEDFPRLARTVCRRMLSLGADGFMVVEKARGDADFRMLFFNADGSVGEMCGNGARCICRFGYENGLAGETQRVETTAGLVIGRRIDRLHYRVALNLPTVIEAEREAPVGENCYRCGYIELGDPGLPHAVVLYPDLQNLERTALRELGRSLRWHPVFPKGANVNFCQVIGPDHVLIRTFERGVEDFTFACGTGSASTALALTRMGLVSGRNVRLQTDGGDLFVDVEQSGDRCTGLFLTGPTNVVAKGEITDDNLTQ